MKKVFKNLIMVAVLLFVAITFSACSSARTMVRFNEDKTVDELVYLTLDKEEIEKNGKNFLEIRQYAESLARLVANEQIVRYVQTSHNANGISLIDVVWYEENSFQVGLRFASQKVYKDFYGITDNNTATWQEEKHFLYSKMYQTGSTIYIANAGLYYQIRDKILMDYPSFITSQNELLYTYETESKREHSDADYITKIDGKYYHTWVISNDNLSKPITIYYNLANRGNIFLICIAASLLACAVLVLIVILKNKKGNKNNQTENLQQKKDI